jgi:hypothetical protein
MSDVDRMGAVLGGAIGAVAVGGMGFYLLSLARRRACGFWPWEVGRLQREGTRAIAIVLSRKYIPAGETGAANYELIVEVRPQGGAPFRVPLVYTGDKLEDSNREGHELPVIFRPSDPSRLLIDFEAVARAKAAAAGEERARDEQRKRDLLAGKGP